MNDDISFGQSQLAAVLEAISGLNEQINDLRKAIETLDGQQQKLFMNYRLAFNKLTTQDNRLAEQNNWIAAHATVLQDLQAWKKNHTEQQDREFAQVGHIIGQVDELRRRMEDTAAKQSMRLDDVAETQHRRFDMHSGRIIELEEWQKARESEIPAIKGIESQLNQLHQRLAALNARLGDAEMDIDRQDEGLTEVEARVADLEDTVFEEPTPAPSAVKYSFGGPVKIEWSTKPFASESRPVEIKYTEMETPIASSVKVQPKLYGTWIESWLKDSFRDASQELTRQSLLNPLFDTTYTFETQPPTAAPKPRCANGCCKSCRDMKKPCHACGHATTTKE